MFNTIIFDLGNVLINWDPKLLYNKLFDSEEKTNHFLENICTLTWNEEQDAGRSLEAGTKALIEEFPQHKTEIEAYYGRWEEMLDGAIEGSVEIFKKLRATGKYKFYALTNWSSELFPIALRQFDFLNWFDGIVVSGDEGIRKPEAAFFQILFDRYQVNPADAVFIDDNLRNVEAARELSIQSIRFTSAEELEKALKDLNVL
ncbi:HAD family phosphatase [uncultured Mucilaginibacter sp.]|uniref:HAD family hydrolase n=1 Tax=uncultured Mucilaginibacter sp. TaxID=797541 RepID=UPI002637E7AE|nr:HAD family phosphatase [uncultured Mucilaginibacter sp.]